MSRNDEERLREEFMALREEDRSTAPEFSATVSAAPRRTTRRHVYAAGVLLFAVLAVAMLVGRRQQAAAPPPRQAQSLLTWSSPTGFLLQTPGQQLWREVPRIGRKALP